MEAPRRKGSPGRAATAATVERRGQGGGSMNPAQEQASRKAGSFLPQERPNIKVPRLLTKYVPDASVRRYELL